MIRYCKIKRCILGFDQPKICVPLVGRTSEEVLEQANQIMRSKRSSAIDMVELRGDYLEILPDYEKLLTNKRSKRKSATVHNPQRSRRGRDAGIFLSGDCRD